MTKTSATTRRLFRVLGTTDEVTECEYCGRAELKGTVVLDLLDEDGASEGVVYYGSGCAATAGKRTVKDIRDSAKVADTAAREAKRAEMQERSRAFIAGRDEWIKANIGADALDHPRRYGYNSTVKIVQAYIEATGNRP